MQHQEFAAPEELQDIIKCFWYDCREFDAQQTVFEVLPDAYAEIIFHFGSGCSIMLNDALQPLPSPFIMGLLNQPALVTTNNHLEIIGIRCFPWTVFDLLGLPSGKDGVYVFDHPVSRLQSVLNEYVRAARIDEAIAQVKQYFLDVRSRITADGMLLKAGVAMMEANGAMPVSQIAVAAHATVRTLERRFKQSAGHTIKDISSLMRFEQVRNRLWRYPDSNIAGLAQELGYTDQSHLSREFKRYSGTTPAAFARRKRTGTRG